MQEASHFLLEDSLTIYRTWCYVPCDLNPQVD
jgi:hypothetical protein